MSAAPIVTFSEEERLSSRTFKRRGKEFAIAWVRPSPPPTAIGAPQSFTLTGTCIQCVSNGRTHTHNLYAFKPSAICGRSKADSAEFVSAMDSFVQYCTAQRSRDPNGDSFVDLRKKAHATLVRTRTSTCTECRKQVAVRDKKAAPAPQHAPAPMPAPMPAPAPVPARAPVATRRPPAATRMTSEPISKDDAKLRHMAIKAQVLGRITTSNSVFRIHESERLHFYAKKKGDKFVICHIASFDEAGDLFRSCRACGTYKRPVREFAPRTTNPASDNGKSELELWAARAKKAFKGISVAKDRSKRTTCCVAMFCAQIKVGELCTERCKQCAEKQSAKKMRTN